MKPEAGSLKQAEETDQDRRTNEIPRDREHGLDLAEGLQSHVWLPVHQIDLFPVQILEPSNIRPTARRTHLLAPLFIFTFIAVLVAVGAFTSQNNLLFWLFGLSLGIILVSGLIGGNMLMAVRATREVVADVAVPGQFVVRYRLTNTSRVWPLFALTVQEIVVDDDGFERQQTGAPASGLAHPPARGRLRGVPTGFVAYVPTRSTVEVFATAMCERRGVVAVSGFRISSAFPFGIISKSLVFGQSGGGTIMARALAPGVALLGKAAAAGLADQSMARSGQGHELFGVREYRHGDMPRLVAWRATARTGELRVRQMAAEMPLRLVLSVCIGRGASEADVERAVSLAAGCVEELGRTGVAFALHVPGDDVRVLMRAGPRHAYACLQALAVAGGRPVESAADALRAVRGAAMVTVVAGDFDSAVLASARGRAGVVIDAGDASLKASLDVGAAGGADAGVAA